MLKFIDENDYRELMGTDSIPSNFNNLVIDASTYINNLTNNRIASISENIKYATCILINILQEQSKKSEEVGNLKAESIEGWSKTYTTSEETESHYNNLMYSTVQKYLKYEIGYDGKPLLYLGVI